MPLHYPAGIPATDRDPELATLVPRKEPTCYGTDCSETMGGQASASCCPSGEPACAR